MFAIVETGGKQYRVTEGEVINVEKLAVPVGDTVTLDRVVMVGDGEDVRIGKPLVEGASVQAKVLGQDRARKIIVYKMKPKERYRRKNGHRQSFTRLQVERIQGGVTSGT